MQCSCLNVRLICAMFPVLTLLSMYSDLVIYLHYNTDYRLHDSGDTVHNGQNYDKTQN